MPQKNVYNELPGTSAEKAAIAGDAMAQNNDAIPAGQRNSNEPATPSAHDAGGVNVSRKGKKTTKSVSFKNLEGDVEITPTPKNFRILAGMTVRIVGVGKFLSGFYYVMSRSISITGSGAMSIKLSVIKTNFGDSLKGEAPINIETEDLIGDKDTQAKSKSKDAFDHQGSYVYSDYPDGTNRNEPSNSGGGGGSGSAGGDDVYIGTR